MITISQYCDRILHFIYVWLLLNLKKYTYATCVFLQLLWDNQFSSTCRKQRSFQRSLIHFCFVFAYINFSKFYGSCQNHGRIECNIANHVIVTIRIKWRHLITCGTVLYVTAGLKTNWQLIYPISVLTFYETWPNFYCFYLYKNV